MRLLLQLALILAVCFIGDFLHRVCGIPLPGNILAMLILFFLPPAIGILGVYDVLKGNILVLLLLSIIATILTMAITGKVTDILLSRFEKKEKKCTKS